MKPPVSVTVPVYNVEKYLRQCLESLCNQTLQDIEIIIVNDGSTDNSGDICREYAEKDPRMKLICKKNGGLASARQTGLDAANGEYIIVCDSDDWVELDMYERLYKKAEETRADIVVCGYYAEYPDGRSVPMQTWFNEKDGFVDNDDFLQRGAGSSWIKLIRKSLFETTGASYEPGVNLSEDALIIYKLLKGNPKICQIKANLYHYRRSFGENTYTNSIKMSHISQMEYTYKWFCNNYCDSKYDHIQYQLALNIAFAILRTKDTDTGYLRKFLRENLPWKKISRHKLSLKACFVSAEKILPLCASKTILKMFYPIVYR